MSLPEATIETLARSIFRQTREYGFALDDHVKLANALLADAMSRDDVSVERVDVDTAESTAKAASPKVQGAVAEAAGEPLATRRLLLRALESEDDIEWFSGSIGHSLNQHFLTTCRAEIRLRPKSLVNQDNVITALICARGGSRVGVAAYLDHDILHRRAEFRLAICDADLRNQGLGREAASAWLRHGIKILGLEKIYAHTIEGDAHSSALLQGLGFEWEALLQHEILLDGVRRDVHRWLLPVAAFRESRVVDG